MPSTPIFSLPYPGPSDAPCDFAEQWCDFTEAIDGVFTTFEAGIARTMPVIPLAIMRLTFQQTVPNGQRVPFDAVSADTAGMTNIDSDPFHITITRAGRYTISGGLELGSDGGFNTDTSMQILAQQTVSASALDRGNSFVYRMNAYHPVQTMDVGDQVSLIFNTGIIMDIIVYAAWISVVWHSDQEMP